MLVWMLYVVTVTLVMSAAAYAAERATRLRRTPGRWVWVLAMVVSLLLPTAISSISVELPSITSPAESRQSIPLRATTSAYLSPSDWIAGAADDSEAWRGADPLLQRAWLIMSGALALFLLASGAHLAWRKRRWSTGIVSGTEVYIATEVGPAVVGLLRPRIVVPHWLTHAASTRQAMVIAHEQSHLEAHDQKLLTLGLCLLVFMPWNLPLWWQLKRLRNAIEVDCDARVLRSGHPTIGYGETLLEVGERQVAMVGPVAAMSEAESFLEERIRIMMRKPNRWWRVSAVACGCLSLCFIAVAAQVSPPNAASTAAQPSIRLAQKPRERKEVAVESRILDRYVGHYQFGESAVLTVARDGKHLTAQLTGQSAAPIFPESNTEFFSKAVDAQFTFVVDAQGQPTALVLHQNGADITAPRVDAAVARQIDVTTTSKIKSQTATPGSETALRDMIAGLISGKPQYERMSPELAKATREQLPQLQSGLASLGEVRQIEFRGVGNQGWDIYDVRHDKGSVQWRIALASNGIIEGALVTAGP